MAILSSGVLLDAGTATEPTAHLEALAAVAGSCEAAGVGLLLLDGRRPALGPWRALDPFTVLGALAAGTRSLCLGAVVAADERVPSLAAKATATLDVCSSGRAVLALASPAAPGQEAIALELQAECVEVATEMLRRPAPTVEGRHVSVQGAWNEPRGPGRPPPVGIVVPVGLGVPAAGIADSWPVPPSFVIAEPVAGATSGAGATHVAPIGLGAPELLSVVLPSALSDAAGAAWSSPLVVRLADPARATPELLSRLAEATGASAASS